jgi:deazaflavin-dependent oxidoreductase (nitroreductase family)
MRPLSNFRDDLMIIQSTCGPLPALSWLRYRTAGAGMGMSARERAFVNRVANPLIVALITRGLGPSTYAVVETTGRKTGRQRPVPVASGLDGDTFWLIAGLGDEASYVRNIKANPQVRVRARPARVRDGLRVRWRAGTAHLLPGDDARARHRQLGLGRPLYRLDGIMLRRLAAGGDMLTIRIDLDRPDSGPAN